MTDNLVFNVELNTSSLILGYLPEPDVKLGSSNGPHVELT